MSPVFTVLLQNRLINVWVMIDLFSGVNRISSHILYSILCAVGVFSSLSHEFSHSTLSNSMSQLTHCTLVLITNIIINVG